MIELLKWFKWLLYFWYTNALGCIDESGNKENKSEISIPAADGNAYFDDTESSRSSKHN